MVNINNEEEDVNFKKNNDTVLSMQEEGEDIPQNSKKKFFSYRLLIMIVTNVLAITYFIFATKYWVQNKNELQGGWCNGYKMLLLIYIFIYGTYLYKIIFKNFHINFSSINTKIKLDSKYEFKWSSIELIICFIFLFAIIIFLIIDTLSSIRRLIGLLGIIILMIFGTIFSKHPSKINWRTVLMGIVIQFVLGLISLRWATGQMIFQCLSDKVVVFLDFAKEGAKFIFSENLVENGVFAFTVLPVIFFFSFFVQILYHLGVMQVIIKNVGWLLYISLGTTACESLHAATTLFLGLPESFLVIEPFMNKLTGSEIHAIMCSAFANTSGTVMAAYISFGAKPVHLITATVMSVPAGLCVAKLLYPEVKESSTTFKNIKLPKSESSNVLDAACKGALSAIPLVLGIVANTVAFVSAVAFLNSSLSWLSGLVGYPELTFEMILAKLFIPLTWIMGVPWEECETVGRLIGLKTTVNEFIAYQRLGEFKKAHQLSARAEAIATFAICGFSNPGSLGILIASLTTMVPEKRKDIINSAIRAFIGGTLVCTLTACIAGILVDDESFNNV